MVIEEHTVPIINFTLHATPLIWWGFHYNYLQEWEKIKIAMEVRFRQLGEYAQDFVKYRGDTNPRQHLQNCERWNWEGVPKELWAHGFMHTLRTFPKCWYVQEETRKRTRDWNYLVD